MEKDSTKQTLCKFLIGLFVITILLCIALYSGTDYDYVSAKADIARNKIEEIRSWNFNPKVDTSDLDKVTQKRYIYIGGIIVSVIGIAISGIVLYGSKNDTPYKYVSVSPTYSNPKRSSGSETQIKLHELKSMHEKGLITEEEYDKKRKEILSRM